MAHKLAGFFITFEGGEGAGKSTQIRLLSERLASLKRPHILTREPGGTIEAEAIRNLLVNGAASRWSAEAEALLNNAARDSHLNAVIKPALAANKIVLCDRFMDSTRAYQGFAGGCSPEFIAALENTIVGKNKPELTLVFDLDPTIGLARAKARSDGSEDRYERKGLAFHQALRQGFLDIAQAEPERCTVIDASASVDAIASAVWTVVEPKLHG